MALTGVQEEVLFLISRGEARCVPDVLRHVLTGLTEAGLAITDGRDWKLTAAGKAELRRKLAGKRVADI